MKVYMENNKDDNFTENMKYYSYELGKFLPAKVS